MLYAVLIFYLSPVSRLCFLRRVRERPERRRPLRLREEEPGPLPARHMPKPCGQFLRSEMRPACRSLAHSARLCKNRKPEGTLHSPNAAVSKPVVSAHPCPTAARRKTHPRVLRRRENSAVFLVMPARSLPALTATNQTRATRPTGFNAPVLSPPCSPRPGNSVIGDFFSHNRASAVLQGRVRYFFGYPPTSVSCVLPCGGRHRGRENCSSRAAAPSTRILDRHGGRQSLAECQLGSAIPAEPPRHSPRTASRCC